MWLDVMKPGPGGLRHPCQGANLIDDEVFHLARLHQNFATTETGQIGEAWVGTDRYTMGDRQTDGTTHHRGIAAMKPARHVGRSDVAQHPLVITDGVGSE